MNINLVYSSGQSYSQRFSNYNVVVSRTSSRVRVSFREKGVGLASASFSLPLAQFKMLAHAGLINCEGDKGDVSPIEFSVDEEKAARAIAA